jgi:hypothetical protein
LRLEAKLSFFYETENEAKAVCNAVSPDNVKVPVGLDVNTVRGKCCLLTSVQCKKSVETFIATLDDLLACISVAEQMFRAIQHSNNR